MINKILSSFSQNIIKTEDGRINLCMAVQDDDTGHHAEKYLRERILLARLPAQTKVIVLQ